MFNSKNNLAINFTLISLIVLFLILTSLFDLYDSYSEHALIEVIQVVVLLSLLIINIRNKAIYLKFSNNFFYRLRNIFWGFLIYEEMSFLTRGVFNFTNKINSNTELNFHNLNFLYYQFFKNIPLLRDIPLLKNSNFIILSTISFLFFIGFGSYFIKNKNIQIIFLKKRYSFYSLIYLLNLLIGNMLNMKSYPLDQEYIELFLYILFTLDSIDKVWFSKSKNIVIKYD